jgi:hypothetical protein
MERGRFLCIPDRRLYIFFWQDTGLAAHKSGGDIGAEGGKKGQKFAGRRDSLSIEHMVIEIPLSLP